MPDQGRCLRSDKGPWNGKTLKMSCTINGVALFHNRFINPACMSYTDKALCELNTQQTYNVELRSSYMCGKASKSMIFQIKFGCVFSSVHGLNPGVRLQPASTALA